MGSAIPPSAPFSRGLDADAFRRHYEAALQDRRLRLKQRAYNAWHFYAGPVVLSLVPGKLIGDWLYPAQGDAQHWLLVAAASALVLAPAILRYRWQHHAHRRFQQFYDAALERCIHDR